MIEALHRLLADSVVDYAIYALTADGRIATWSAGAERLKGYSASEIVGQPVSRFYPPETRDASGTAPRSVELLRLAERDGRAQDEGWRVRRDGSRFWAHVVITPVRHPDGALLGFAKVTRDLTAQRAAQEDALRLAAERAAREVAEAAQAEATLMADRLQDQAVELEAQTEEAQCLAEELEEANRHLQEVALEAEAARDAAEAARRTAEELEARYRRLFEASPLASWTADAETLRILDVNEAAVARYGYSRAEFARLTLFDLGDPTTHAALGDQAERVRAAGELRTLTRHRTKSGEMLDVELTARHIVQDGRPAMVVVLDDVTQRLRDTARQRFLVEATALLGDSLDYDATLARIVRLAVPALADWAAYNVVDGDFVRTVAIHHPDPAMETLARAIDARYPMRADAPAGVARVIATGEPQLISDIPDELLRAVAYDEAHYEELRSIGFRSLINVPLVARGRVLGALGFATGDSGRRFSAEDLAFAEEMGRRAGLALDNALHFRDEQAARARAELSAARLEGLRRLASETSMVVEADTLVRLVVRGARDILGAAAAYVVRRSDDPTTLEFLHGEGFPDGYAGGYARFPLAAPVPGAHVVREGAPLWLESPAERQRVFGHLADSPITRAFHSSATLPLMVRGETVGALGLYYAEPRRFAPDDRAFLAVLADQVALSLERVRLFEAERLARAAAAAAQARAEFLAEASRLLASSLDYRATLEALARAAVPRLGDWCAVDMRSDLAAAGDVWPPLVERLAVMNQDPARIEWARELEGRQPQDWSAPGGLPRVLRDGATEFQPVITDEQLVASARSPEELALPREIGFSAYLCVPLRAQGRVVGAISLCMSESGRRYDEDDRRLAEELAQRASLAIEHAMLYEAAREANAVKAQFLATMSHELRTPLNAIGGYVDLLEMGLRGPLSEAQRADLRRVRRSQQHLLALISDLLEFARLEAGQTTFRTEAIRLFDAIEAAKTLVATQAASKALTLLHEDCGSDVEARADNERVEQILVNLLSNAVKFTPSGGRITVRCERGDDVARIVVEDTGIGVPTDRLEAIFEPFVQVESGLTRSSQGTGLGLAISRDLARRMGGDLTVVSTLGRGSTFTLTLPRA
ncbi:MAG TPA: GAF domain-containing protein [Gemmatimonadaceae bacterium]|nr:GAF domain-containing protein [Gemmatimonadaceae bacterium]